MPTETLARETPPAGATTGVSTEEPAGANHQSEPGDDDPLGHVYLLLQAASIQGMEGVQDVRYDLPDIRLGLQWFLDQPDPFPPNEVHEAVLAAVSRGIQPERLVGYAEVVLERARAKARERERLRLVIAETVHTGQDGGETLPATPPHLLATEQDERYPPPDKEVLALWQSALSELELQMTRATFDTWLRPSKLLAWEPNSSSTRVVLGVPNSYVKDWLENRLIVPIRRTLADIAGQPVEIEFQVGSTQGRKR
jgi:hypothetical protein